MYNREFAIAISLLLSYTVQAQMKSGDYPFQIIDTSISETQNEFEVHNRISTNDFYSILEDWYNTAILLELMEDKLILQINESNNIEINTPHISKQIVTRIEEAAQVRNFTNSRSLIASISNNSVDTLLFPTQDASIIAIMEAINQSGEWSPIEYWPISRCGDSYWNRYLLPGKTLLVTVQNKYGDIPAMMRLRVHGNDTIYVSDSFSGYISVNSFVLPDNVFRNHRAIMCDTIIFLEKPFKGVVEVRDTEYDFTLIDDEK